MALRHPVPILNSFTYITNILVSVKYSSVYVGTAHYTNTVLGHLDKNQWNKC